MKEIRSLTRRIIRRILMFLVGIITLIFWLPFGRALIEGDVYEWGLFGVGGAGVNSYFVIPTLGVLGALIVRWIGQRGGRRAAGGSIIGFYGVLLILSIVIALTNPDSMVVRGDTVGMNLSIAWLGPVVLGAATLAGVWWTLRSTEVQAAAGWSRTSWIWFGMIGLLLTASIFLFLDGEQHGTTDEWGVGALGWAWLLLDGVLVGSSPVRLET